MVVTQKGSVRAAAWLLGFVAAGLASPGPAQAQPKHLVPVPAATVALMTARDMSPSAPILIRTYKKEAELEVWKRNRSGRFVHLKTFPICRWSGALGPKLRTGDRQVPEGFYAVPPGKMNPNSAYHLSFDIGYPNSYDRAHGATGSHLMVHGACSSAGCFSMTDKVVSEVYGLARDAFAGGQAAFQVQAFPFRMTAENMARYRTDKHIGFWRQLKEGSDRFEATGEEPAVTVAAGRYAFTPYRDPAKEGLAVARVADGLKRVETLVQDGAAAVRTSYADGGMHPSFRTAALAGAFGEVSRPEALAGAGRDVVVIAARKKPAVVVAEAPPRRPDVAGPAAAPALSVFAAAPLGTAPGWSGLPLATLAGSAAILPPTLEGRRVGLASLR